MFCYTHIYAKSKKNRKVFLFLSWDKLVKGVDRKKLNKDLNLLDDAKKGNVRKSNVKVCKVPQMTYDIRMGVQDCFIPRNEMDKARIIRENMGLRCDFFQAQKQHRIDSGRDPRHLSPEGWYRTTHLVPKTHHEHQTYMRLKQGFSGHCLGSFGTGCHRHGPPLHGGQKKEDR